MRRRMLRILRELLHAGAVKEVELEHVRAADEICRCGRRRALSTGAEFQQRMLPGC